MSPLVPEPGGLDSVVHFVLCDFGVRGQAYVETDPDRTDRDTIVTGLVRVQYPRPLKVIALREDGTWRDVSIETAWSVMKAAVTSGCLQWVYPAQLKNPDELPALPKCDQFRKTS